MPHAQTISRSEEALAYLNSVDGESVSFGQLFDLIGKSVQFTEGMVVTTLPRGTLQISQPPRFPEPLLRSYSRHYHAEDSASWRAIWHGRAVRAEDCWREGDKTAKYLRQFMEPNGLQYIAAIPLSGPVLEGYPGALHLYRSAEQGDFSDGDMEYLTEIGRELDTALDRVRNARISPICREERHWAHRPPVRMFIFDQRQRLKWPAEMSHLDEELQRQMTSQARRVVHGLDDEPFFSQRRLLPDTHGDNWHFRVVGHKKYPALGEGAFVFFNLQPEYCDWGAVRPTDFQADPEVSRLIPAVQFMHREFHRSPTLVEISATVNLSPFHFHRRFTELLGLTPKHLLLECQVFEAKRQLLAREKELARISADTGFAHQSHFTSRFKQAVGLTPTRWRRLMSQPTM